MAPAATAETMRRFRAEGRMPVPDAAWREATALFHGKSVFNGAPTEQVVEEARDWAMNVYLPALMQGNALTGERRATVRRDLARYTGISEAFIERADLRTRRDRLCQPSRRQRGGRPQCHPCIRQ